MHKAVPNASTATPMVISDAIVAAFEQHNIIKMLKSSSQMQLTLHIFWKHLSGKMGKEHCPHFQAATSSSRMVCSMLVHMGNTSHKALLDTGSTISSIRQYLVHELGLTLGTTTPITVLFGDNNQVYHTNTQTHNLPTNHSINTGKSPPICIATCRRLPLEEERINQAVDEMLKKGVIRPSCSDWVSEPHLVKKDDGSFRFCIDFRPLNKINVHDLYPLPRLDDLLDQLGKSKYFTSLDLAFGYWQIPMNPTDAVFRTSCRLFKFTRMPFGLSDAGSAFQRVANTIFQDLISKGEVLVYLDDIVIHTPTWERHLQVLKTILQRVQHFNLQLQLRKCKWGATKLKILGFQMDPSVAARPLAPTPSQCRSDALLALPQVA
ncbi:hypothetical protein L7F22_007950 [Adiantum nelumboides]|nr:hypothetical protein [Adiantum nelumboides]